MVELSRPPDRNAPNGTSLTISIFTDSSSLERNSRTVSRSFANRAPARAGVTASLSGALQYRRSLSFPSFHVAHVPGASLRMPCKSVFGPGT